MYGYHENDCSFLKVYLYNPDLIKRLSDLLVNGIIMNETFQPYNSHIPYNLQV
jgi:DNA polymerase zeta